MNKSHALINKLFLHHHTKLADAMQSKALKLYDEAAHAAESIEQVERQILSLQQHRLELLSQYSIKIDQAKGQRNRTQQIKELLDATTV